MARQKSIGHFPGQCNVITLDVNRMKELLQFAYIVQPDKMLFSYTFKKWDAVNFTVSRFGRHVYHVQ